MSELITDEIVEAVARGSWDADPAVQAGDATPWDGLDECDRSITDGYRAEVRTTLEAAAPLIAARVLEEAAELRHGTDLTPTVMSLGAGSGPDPAWWYQYLQGLDETWRANLRARAQRAKEGRS